jgi:uncharacterized protein
MKVVPSPIRSKSISQVIFGLIYLLMLIRFIWPLQLPLSIKIVMAALALVALQFHRAIVLLGLLQLVLDAGLLFGILIHGGAVGAPDSVRYGLAALAAAAAAIGVHQAIRIPPLKDIEVGICGLPRQFDGYTIL